MLAGFSLASMNIAQVMGYARIAGMPAISGLYTVLLPLVAFAIFGSSRHLVVAADSATAAIFSSGLAGMAPAGSAPYMALVSVVALLNACFLLVARLCRLGFLADFLSRTVLVGFLAGVGVQVSISMVFDMLGLVSNSRNGALQLFELGHLWPHAHGLTLVLSVAACVVLLAGQKLLPHWPVALLVAATGIALGWGYALPAHGVAVLGPVQGGLPSLRVPLVGWDTLLALLPVSASCVFVIIAQSAATSRAYAYRFGESVDENKDILGLSAANAAAGLSGTFTVNGSPTQTAMAVQSGATSQRAQLVFAAITLCVLLFLTGPLQYLPRCILASVVFCVAVGMVDVAGLMRIRRESPGECTLALVTAATVVSIGVEQGIFIAIALSLFRHVRHSYKPHTLVLRPDAATGAMEAEPVRAGMQTEPGLVIYRFCADLFYANCTLFAEDITLLVNSAPQPVHCLVVDCSAITDIDYSAAAVVRDVLARLQARQVHVFFGRVAPYALADMERHRIALVLGRQNIYAQLHVAIAAARAAYAQRPPTA
ncbi:SulP family inorganic anion transporter [Acetobacter sp. TBRC 12305]|uniref:SulP family inorganic anion transporter n=2 Tax=Acetobacter garciniae TaxID=2817435 RepID=A0A939KRE7_9PROT|nr:SulP family inorganic anion transporter [Acetobacter garciniae]MBX0344677.1 SulP family inorganic anion transporter [Acetobacter garciniae]